MFLYICNCLKMPEKSQLNKYSDTLFVRALGEGEQQCGQI